MLETLKPVSKAIAAFVAGAVVAWAATKGLNLPADTSQWLQTGIEVGLGAVFSAAAVWLAPSNK